MFKILVLFLLSLESCNINSTENKSNFQKKILEEKIEFISKQDTLVGFLSKPKYKDVFPVVIVLHSANHGNHNSNIYNHLEQSMNDIGVGVFTYDRRGTGESGGNFTTASLEDLANDALNAIKKLKLRSDIDKDNIGLFGISQGGWLAPLAYKLDNKDISFMILVSSSGVSPAKQMEYSAVTTLKINKYSEDVISKAKYLRQITNEYYRGKRDRKVTQEIIDTYRNEAWFNDVYLPWRGNLPKDVSTTKWIHEMDFNPKAYFENVKVPIAIIYGETDRWVPIEESISVWKQSLGKARNEDYEIFRIKNSGHMMIINEDKNPQEEVISEQYQNILQEWVGNMIEQ